MRAGDLARRVGRVVQAVRRGGLADGEVAHAALHAWRCARTGRAARMRLNLARLKVTPSAMRQRAARQPGAGAARDHRHASRWQARSTAATCSSVSGSATTSGMLAVGGEAVAFVRRGVLALPQQRMRGQQRRQLGDHGRLAARPLGGLGGAGFFGGSGSVHGAPLALRAVPPSGSEPSVDPKGPLRGSWRPGAKLIARTPSTRRCIRTGAGGRFRRRRRSRPAARRRARAGRSRARPTARRNAGRRGRRS